MGTKTIGLREDVYDRLKAQKRGGESFTDTIDRLLESTADWRDGFGTLSTAEATELEALVADSRERTADGLNTRQQDAIEELAAITADTDETA